MDDAYILITKKKLSSLNELLPLLEAVVQTGKPLVIVAEDSKAKSRHPRRQPSAWRSEGCRRQGSGLRRSPQRPCCRTSRF